MAVKTSTSSLARLSLPAKFVFALILMGIVDALYFVVFFTDVEGQINQAIDQEQSLKGELQQAEEAKAAYQKDVEERAKKQQSEREQRKVLPDEAETPSFLSSVQGIATISGVTLKTYKPEDEGSEEYYVRVPMSLELEGRFHQIARFFFGVGQLDRVINIENIEMEVMPTQAASDTGEVVLAVKCLATAFRSKKSGEPEKGKK